MFFFHLAYRVRLSVTEAVNSYFVVQSLSVYHPPAVIEVMMSECRGKSEGLDKKWMRSRLKRGPLGAVPVGRLALFGGAAWPATLNEVDHTVSVTLCDEPLLVQGVVVVEKPDLLGCGGLGLFWGGGRLLGHGSGLLSGRILDKFQGDYATQLYYVIEIREFCSVGTV